MALQFSGTGQNLSIATAVVTAVPCSFACWINPAAFLGVPGVMFVTDSLANNRLGMFINTTGTVAAQSDQASTSVAATSVITLTAGTWYHLVAVFASATSRTLYINGASAATNATNNTPTGLASSSYASIATGHMLNGTIAYPGIWGVALSAGDVTSLYNAGAGADPSTVQHASLLSLNYLQSSPFVDAISSTTWTITGSPTIVADPFTISGLTPTVTASAATSITTTAAVLNGNISSTGGTDATVAGFNWGLTTGYGNVASTTADFGTGAFSQPLAGLTANTTYHYQAFATNPNGTGTSTDATFSTNAVSVVSTAMVDSTMLLSGLSGAMATLLFPLATLQRNEYRTFQEFAHKMGWDTRVDVAQAFFSNLS